MSNQQEIVNRAREDLSRRLGLDESNVTLASLDEVEFPDAALGAPLGDEMSAQVITPGLRIRLEAGNEIFEYRASGTRLRLYNFKGENYRVGA